jgi:hypothetical protein
MAIVQSLNSLIAIMYLLKMNIFIKTMSAGAIGKQSREDNKHLHIAKDNNGKKLTTIIISTPFAHTTMHIIAFGGSLI